MDIAKVQKYLNRIRFAIFSHRKMAIRVFYAKRLLRVNNIIKFKINQGGYVPGERLQFAVQIDNKSKRKIKPLKVEFYEETRIYAESKSTIDSRLITTVTNNKSIEPLQNYEWKDESSSFVLPPLCNTSNGHCKIIDLRYILSLSFSPSGSSFSAINIPIIIGKLFVSFLCYHTYRLVSGAY